MFSNQRQASLCIVLNLGMWCHTSQDKFIKSCEKTYTEIDSKKTQDFRWLLRAWDHENQVEVEPESWIDLNML
jgi:hypothetical protein